MNVSAFVLMFLTFTAIFITIQRSEQKRRLFVFLIMLLPLILLQRYADYRALHSEAQLAFFLALILSFLFWLLIGRYNPVRGDQIRVLGMDD